MWVARLCDCNAPNAYLISNGIRSMGYALPGAVGATYAHRDHARVVAVCGDAGFLNNVQDLETAARERRCLTIVTLVDGTYALTTRKQQE